MIEMNDRDGEWIQKVYNIRQKHKWLMVAMAIMTLLMLFFMYQMIRRENLIKAYHHTVIRQGYFEIHQAKNDLTRAMDYEDGKRYDLIESALEHIEDTVQIFRLPYNYYNFKMTGSSQIIGNGAASEYFNHYIYLINDWIWEYEVEDKFVENQSLEDMIEDLEALTLAYMNPESRADNPSIEMMDYGQLQDLFLSLLVDAKSDFTYESFLYPLD